MTTPLRAIRETRGLRLLDIAAAAQVSIETVRKLDRGQFSSLKLRSLVVVAYALGVAPSELVPGLDCRPRNPGPLGRRRGRESGTCTRTERDGGS